MDVDGDAGAVVNLVRHHVLQAEELTGPADEPALRGAERQAVAEQQPLKS